MTLVFLMLDHIGGINTLLNVLSQGGTIVTPANRTPDAVCEAIARYGVETKKADRDRLNGYHDAQLPSLQFAMASYWNVIAEVHVTLKKVA